MRLPSTAVPTAAALVQILTSVATFFVVKIALAHFPWPALATLRAFGAALLFSGLLFARWDQRPRGWNAAKTLALGVVGVTLNQACYAAGMTYTTPDRAALLYCTTPLLVLLIGWARKNEEPSSRRLVGMVLAFAGVAIVLADRGALHASSALGDAIILFGAVCWATYSALSKELVNDHDPFAITAVALIGGTVLMLPIGVPALAHVDWATIPASAWAAVAFLSVFTSFIAYTCWFIAIRGLPPSRVAVFMYLQPPLTFAASWWLLGERLGAVFLGGAVLTLVGVGLAQFDPARKSAIRAAS